MSNTKANPAESVSGGNRVIIIGGGLAGVAAAHSVLQHGGSVLLLDKSAFLGGNSTKASSGIAGTPTQAQMNNKVIDGVDLFIQDTNNSFHGVSKNTTNDGTSTGAAAAAAGPVSPLVSEMARLSGPSLEWLTHYFKCDLTKLGFMGGHSRPRTHRGTEKFPGMAITYALISALEAIAKAEPQRARIITKARVVRLLRGAAVGAATGSVEPVTGVVYVDRKGNEFIERGAVIIATGGYAADQLSNNKDRTADGQTDSLLNRFAPQLMAFATTNAEHATGDGIKMAEAVGAGLIDMERVQVHPTGLVDPKEPQNPVKFLCAEATRGAGGIIVNKHGQRCVDELARRDQASAALLAEAQKGNEPFYLILNARAAEEMKEHCKHYVARGLMKAYPSAAEFCAESGIKPAALAETYEAYKKAAEVNKKSRGGSKSGGGFLSALFGGGSGGKGGAAVEEKGGFKGTPDAFGKTLFRNAEHFSPAGAIHVARITPVVHYTMGGLLVNERAQVMQSGNPHSPGPEGKVIIPGLFCAGEAAGGIHGKNRLGGNSLLDCVVYGRVAGEEATKYLLGHFMGPFSSRRLNTIYAQLDLKDLPPVQRKLSPVRTAPTTAAAAAAAAVPAPAAAAATASAPAAAAAAEKPAGAAAGAAGRKTYTRAEVAKHNTEKSCWVILHKAVLDITEFLPDHPGGKQSVLMYAGKDATKEFDMVHQADVIEKYTPEAVIGVVSD